MVLQVEFQHLLEEINRLGLKPWVYVSAKGHRTLVSCGEPHQHLVIESITDLPIGAAQVELSNQGLLVAHGRWVPDPLAGEIQIEESISVASVAYISSETKPGLWVHAYRGVPTPGDVLKDFFLEMSQEAGLDNVPMEQFLQEVEPNVVILSPDEMVAMAAQTR